MACWAKISITGRLTREPKQNSVNGTTVINFSVAVFTTKKEGDKYVADYYNVNYWGKAAENVSSKLKKGGLVHVYGDLTLEDYVDKSGNKQKGLSVRASDVISLDASMNKTQTESKSSEEEYPF